MPAIRQNLGVCPQFDILWPDITVREHLQLYAQIKGYSALDAASVALAAAVKIGGPLHITLIPSCYPDGVQYILITTHSIDVSKRLCE